MIKLFRNESPSAGTFPVAVKEEGVYCRKDQSPSRVEGHRDVLRVN